MSSYIDLNDFVDPWNLPPKDAPISMPPVCLATNGQIAICAYPEAVIQKPDDLRQAETKEGDLPFGSEATQIAEVLEIIHTTTVGRDRLDGWHPLPAFEPPFRDRRCELCGGTGSVMGCSSCGGEGVAECECCGGETECDLCDGKKMVIDHSRQGHPCPDCAGTGALYTNTTVDRSVTIRQRKFDSHYLKMIEQLPDLEVSLGTVPERGHALAFRFRHGIGAVMELVDPREEAA